MIRRGDEGQTVPVRPRNDAISVVTTPDLFSSSSTFFFLVVALVLSATAGVWRRPQAVVRPSLSRAEMKVQKLRCCSRRGRLLACFEPPAVADDHAVQEEKQMRAAASLLGSLPGSSPPALTPSSSSGSSLTDGEGKPLRGEGSGKRKRFSPRLLAKIIRSAVFVTSLQKAHNGESLRYRKQLPPQPEASGERPWDEDVPSSETGFSSSSFSSSSSTSSGLLTITSSSQPTLARTGTAPERKTAPTRPHRDRIRGDSASASASASAGAGDDDSAWTGPCLLLLLVLFVLVFWGRLCAIVWTSACLCLVPGRDGSDGTTGRGPPRVPSAGRASMRRVSAEEWEKRRVVMAGLLDRSRRP